MSESIESTTIPTETTADSSARLTMCARIRTLTEQNATLTRTIDSLQDQKASQNSIIDGLRKANTDLTSAHEIQQTSNATLRRTILDTMDQNKSLSADNKQLRAQFQAAVIKLADYEVREEEMRISMAALHSAFLELKK